jgi:hypothetical protein
MARSRSVWVLAVVVAALCCTVAVQSGSAQTAPEVLPDLVADAPARPQLQTYAHPDGTTHLLLRFDGFVHNRGQGALEVRGSQPLGGVMQATVQRVYRSDGSFTDDGSRDPEIIWEPEDGHDHWHLKDAARYSLWNAAKTAEVAPAMKVGFCLIDSQRIETNGPSSARYTVSGNNFCGQDEPQRSSITEGVSAGWRDIYDRTLAFQWVDVTDVQPGTYWLRSEIDPEDFVREASEVNPSTFAAASSTIPGYRARPVDAGVVSATTPTQINLATDSFGSNLGPRAFRIFVPPKHGTLSVPNGRVFSSSTVTYTPDPGWVGPDSFVYTARDSLSSFPRYPAGAAVTLNVGGVSPSVAISGAPQSLQAGTSVRLFASVTADDPYVYWTVDGISPGSPETGTVDSWGLYRAPPQAPPSGQVTIRATTASGAFDEVTIGITNPPAPQPAPTVESALALAGPSPSTGGPTAPSAASDREFRSRLRGVKLATDGRAVVVSARSRRAGVMRVRVHKHEQLLGRCRARMPRGRTLTCRVRLAPGMSAGDAQVVITLRVKGALVEVRRTALPDSPAHAGQHGPP